MPPLTPKQERFVQEYLIDLNATEAAKRAGYSPATAYSIGWETLRKPEVAAALTASQQERAARVEVTADDVLRETARIAFSDITAVFDPEANQPTLRPMREWPADVRRAVASIKTKQYRPREGSGEEPWVITEVKFCDKLRALEVLAKHLGLLVERVRVEGEDNLADLIREARTRAAAAREAGTGTTPRPSALFQELR